jgi:hypothetical protein
LEETKKRSTPPQKKTRIFTHPDFSAIKLGKKSAQIMRVNTVCDIIKVTLKETGWDGVE